MASSFERTMESSRSGSFTETPIRDEAALRVKDRFPQGLVPRLRYDRRSARFAFAV
jgi:hypothetical protein